jgi:hypothetical protein
MSEVPLTIPIHTSEVPAGEVVIVDGIRLTMETASGTKWQPGWTSQGMVLWPEGGQNQISSQIDRKMFDPLKSQTGTLHIEFALTEYQPQEARDLGGNQACDILTSGIALSSAGSGQDA